jgi:tetratricopeptide (TPR) repeat protein
MAILISILLLPLLLLALIQGARLGLFGLAEFICGLCYMPAKMLGSSGRSMYLLGLLYSGMGRFDEALKCFRRSENNDNIFDKINSSPWNERHRLPELLARLGRSEEAWALAKHNVEQARRDFADIDCMPVREKLQCDLIVAAAVLSQSGQGETGGQYLEEACTLGKATDPAEKILTEHNSSKQKDRPPAPSHSEILALYAKGLLNVQMQSYQEGIAALEQCCRAILERREADKGRAGPLNSELLGFCRTLLGQCYLKSGQPANLEEKAALSPPLHATK